MTRYVAARNIAQRGHWDGTPEQQRDGMICQVIVYKYLFEKWPDLRQIPDKPDPVDIYYNLLKIDVKGVRQQTFTEKHYHMNLAACQAHYKSDTIIFCGYHLLYHMVEILGWIPKKEICQAKNYRHQGTVEPNGFKVKESCFTVLCRDLLDIEILKMY